MHLFKETVRCRGVAAIRVPEPVFRAERRLSTGEIRIRKREEEQEWTEN